MLSFVWFCKNNKRQPTIRTTTTATTTTTALRARQQPGSSTRTRATRLPSRTSHDGSFFSDETTEQPRGRMSSGFRGKSSVNLTNDLNHEQIDLNLNGNSLILIQQQQQSCNMNLNTNHVINSSDNNDSDYNETAILVVAQTPSHHHQHNHSTSSGLMMGAGSSSPICTCNHESNDDDQHSEYPKVELMKSDLMQSIFPYDSSHNNNNNFRSLARVKQIASSKSDPQYTIIHDDIAPKTTADPCSTGQPANQVLGGSFEHDVNDLGPQDPSRNIIASQNVLQHSYHHDQHNNSHKHQIIYELNSFGEINQVSDESSSFVHDDSFLLVTPNDTITTNTTSSSTGNNNNNQHLNWQGGCNTNQFQRQLAVSSPSPQTIIQQPSNGNKTAYTAGSIGQLTLGRPTKSHSHSNSLNNLNPSINRAHEQGNDELTNNNNQVSMVGHQTWSQASSIEINASENKDELYNQDVACYHFHREHDNQNETFDSCLNDKRHCINDNTNNRDGKRKTTERVRFLVG